VRFIGTPRDRIAEDHLRILRFFRFSARFGAALDPGGLEACAAMANSLMALSRERIRDELIRILVLPAPADTLGAMVTNGILAPVVPEIGEAGVAALRTLIAAEQKAGAEAGAVRRLAALLPADPDVAGDVGVRLRLPRAEQARLRQAADRTAVPADPRALAHAIGAEATVDRLLLTDDPRAGQWLEPLRSWQRPRLPISGKDLIAMGVPPGPAVSKLLGEVETRWMAAGFPGDRNAVVAMARAVMGVR
jgi:poly(A) polymerase